MTPATRFSKRWLACVCLAASSLACSLGGAGGPPPVATLGAPPESASPGPQPTSPPAQAGPGEVVVSGGMSLRFQTASTNALSFSSQFSVYLYESDGVSGVTLFFPDSTQPGTYSIGDLFHLADTEITARFDHVDPGAGNSYWESLDGTLVITQVTPSLSGSFTFTAARTPEGVVRATIEGNFEDVAVSP